MVTIKSVHAREILDSRGNPTVEVELTTRHGTVTASVPSGASTGTHEACELRDGGFRYHGGGVLHAVKNVNTLIASRIKGKDFGSQENLDAFLDKLDGTKNKSKLGANAILAVSMAGLRANAIDNRQLLHDYIHKISKSKEQKLPIPAFNIINGGKHAGGMLPIQEFMILPVGARRFSQAVQMGSEVYHELQQLLKKSYGPAAINVGDEGGFAPPFTHAKEALTALCQAIARCGYQDQIKIGMDVAASEFWNGKKYHFDGGNRFSNYLLHWYEEMCKEYPIISIEDPFHQEDFHGFALATKHLPCQIVGDDLLTTNVERIAIAIKHGSCNALLLKINQIGTITEAINAWRLATKHNWKVMVSHRSGETEDSFIADLVVGLGTGQIKAGAPCRGERLAKYNQLLRIEERMGTKARYAKWS